MNHLDRVGGFAALLCLSTPCLQAAPNGDSGWSLSVGVQVRRVDVGFQIEAPDPINPARLFSRRGNLGPGDVGVATSGTDYISYLDGTVGTNADTGNDYDTSFSVDSLSQVVFGTQAPGEDFPMPGTVTFHSTGTTFQYDDYYQSRGFDAHDSEVVASPYIELRRNLCQEGPVLFDLAIGWSYLESEHGSGTRTVLTQGVRERETRSRYTYVYDLPETAGDAPSAFPPVFSNASSTGVIYDADAYNAFAGVPSSDPFGVENPRTTRSGQTSDRLIAFLEAESSATLDVDAHVIPILLDARCEVTPGISVGIGAGPTLNVISHELTSQTDWLLNGSPFASDRVSNAGTDVVVGATVRGTVSIVLSDDGTFLFEAGGGYDWVPTQTVTAGPAHAEIDLSSWMGFAGFCKLF